ncbi:hypothetical protein NDU88_004123 [Pleurodeles waltl]|uniref:Uncharacterized protein n=1 Tax=Pleurodeles waltl TaxID=8319 RepID=A0AAV7WU67_PLEWA|nr:hypothetical protein NDU88_004123 [Pleurodeles waltl]
MRRAGESKLKIDSRLVNLASNLQSSSVTGNKSLMSLEEIRLQCDIQISLTVAFDEEEENMNRMEQSGDPLVKAGSLQNVINNDCSQMLPLQ